ncbi:Histidine kinase OS=Streptomyces glaucescens OX=1907 GN=SGLAU_07630 PE=4 SV=1 [Streptomyces glaucescens]
MDAGGPPGAGVPGAALCWADVLSRPVTPLWRTADWGYVRFHQGRAQPWPRYGRQALETWLRRIAGAFDDGRDVYTYFNNDPGGAAVQDAMAFARAASARGRTATRTPPAPTPAPAR